MSAGSEPDRVIRLVVDVNDGKPYATSGRHPSSGSGFSLRYRLAGQIWGIVWLLLFRPTPASLHAWRRLLLRCFGARVAPGARISGGAWISAPWNLVAGRGAAIADRVEIHNPARIELGEYAVLSQGACLCGASLDFESWESPLVSAPIMIGAHAWIAARAIVRMGVTIGAGCVVGAGSVVTQDMPAWTVCAGAPARVIREYTKR
jgi:putative colanic acid biosynthesis acetyltransferase WcaF